MSGFFAETEDRKRKEESPQQKGSTRTIRNFVRIKSVLDAEVPAPPGILFVA
jgi:hypothetical protein